jgi:site-specific recombinase XerD
LGVVPVPPPSRQRPGETVLADFATRLSVECALSPRTIVYYLNLTRPFVEAFWGDDGGALARVNARDVAGCVAARLPIMENEQAKRTVTALRAFLRYTHIKIIHRRGR